MKVLFVLPNIAVGGVERVRLSLIEYLSARGIECRLALRQCRGELLERARSLATVYELAPLGIHQFVPSLARLIKREQPTHVVTAFSDVAFLTWVSLRLTRSRAKWVHTVDVADAVADSAVDALEKLRFNVRRSAANVVYRRADAVIAVSQGVYAELTGEHALDPRRVVMLYNPVVPDIELGWRRPSESNDCAPCRVVAIGRLTAQKGFDILVNAMARVRGAWRLTIWGEGADRTKLVSQIGALGLQDRIRLSGYAPDPFSAMRDADVFVMPSRFEGFGNVLVEALACQCRIVAADCPHGPREILQDGRLGELVPVGDVGKLAAAIERAMSGQLQVDVELLRERARDFSTSKSGQEWELLLHGLSDARPAGA